MHEQKSLQKIKSAINIHKKKAFQWRHKILSSFQEADKQDFNGIVENDEAFFLQSDKGNRKLKNNRLKHGGTSFKKWITNDQGVVIVTADHKGTMVFSVATMWLIEKKESQNAIGNRISKDSILCTNLHGSYKRFVKDSNLTQIVLGADLKQHVKWGISHIQKVNSLYNMNFHGKIWCVILWIGSTFKGIHPTMHRYPMRREWFNFAQAEVCALTQRWWQVGRF